MQFRWRHTFEGYTPGTFSDTDDDAAAEDEDTFAKAVKHGAASEQLQESLGKYRYKVSLWFKAPEEKIY